MVEFISNINLRPSKSFKFLTSFKVSEKMSSAQYNAGQSRANTQAKTEGLMESAKNTTQSAHDKAIDALNSTQAQAQQSKEEKAGFLQQTGDQVVHMAEGAIDGVKNTLGVGDKK